MFPISLLFLAVTGNPDTARATPEYCVQGCMTGHICAATELLHWRACTYHEEGYFACECTNGYQPTVGKNHCFSPEFMVTFRQQCPEPSSTTTTTATTTALPTTTVPSSASTSSTSMASTTTGCSKTCKAGTTCAASVLPTWWEVCSGSDDGLWRCNCPNGNYLLINEDYCFIEEEYRQFCFGDITTATTTKGAASTSTATESPDGEATSTESTKSSDYLDATDADTADSDSGSEIEDCEGCILSKTDRLHIIHI